MDDNNPGIEVSDELYTALAQQAEANQRTPDEELCAILKAAIEAATENPS